MKQGFQMFSKWGISAKLVALFAIFGLLPMAAVGYLGSLASGEMEDAAGNRVQGIAENIADKIDRNLFERYGDVQIFGSNRIVAERGNWYSQEYNEIAEAMNDYVSTYGLYYLMILVDPAGKVIAVNGYDGAGNPLDTTSLYAKNYADATWFKALEAEEYTISQPFSAPGNDASMGTFVEDVHVDEDVKAMYPDEDGLVLGFSAPVYEDGELIAYWSNRAKFSVVEEIVQAAYQELKMSGFPNTEITLLGDKGQVLMDYDPSRQGSEDVTHDFEKTLLQLNLAKAGVLSAQEAVAGKTGYIVARHARKNIWQMGGYSHLKGALGFPGMNWSVLVRIAKDEVLASAIAFNRNLMMTAVVCVGLILVVGFWVGRQGARQVRRVQEAADKMATGEYDARVLINSQDEIGQLGTAFNTMASEIQANITQQAQANQEMVRIKTGLDNSSSNVMICDRDLNIIYVNKKLVKTLETHEKEIQKSLPNFAVSKLVGANIDGYHKNPAHQRKLLEDPKNLPYQSNIQIGPLELTLNVAAIMSDTGEYLGNVVEWSDVTAQKKAEREVDALIGAAAKGQLGNRMNADEFSGFFHTLSTGVNQLMEAISSPLAEAQQVLTTLAAGDLTKQMTGAYEGEFEKIKVNLNGAIENLTSIVQSVREGAGSVSTAAEEITKGNEDLSERTSAQAGALEETSTSMEEMTSTIKQNADNAKQANQLAVTAREVAEKGGAVTEKAVEAMSEINKSSKKIADIINVIDEIAFQTNLLALNAAVEAARAGEQGRGFAVVASEVRNLAQRSATAAKEIKALINESVQKVGDGSDLVNQSGQTLAEIVNSVKRVTDIIAEISAASQEQASGIDQVNKAVMQMDQGTQQNAALVEEATSASQSMRQQAAELTNQVSFFKVSEEDIL